MTIHLDTLHDIGALKRIASEYPYGDKRKLAVGLSVGTTVGGYCAAVYFADDLHDLGPGQAHPIAVLDESQSNAALVGRSRAIDAARRLGLPFVE